MSNDRPQLVRTDAHDGIATVTLTNEFRRNAITISMVEQFVATWDRLEADDRVGAAVITSSGPAFCAGADLLQLAKAASGDEAAKTAVRDIYVIFERVRRCVFQPSAVQPRSTAQI